MPIVSDQLRETNRAVVRKMFARSGTGPGRLKEIMTDDVRILEPSFLPYGRLYEGHADLPVLAAAVTEYLDPETCELINLVAEGEVVVALLKLKDRKTNEYATAAEVFEFRDGKITDVTVFFNQAQSLAVPAGR